MSKKVFFKRSKIKGKKPDYYNTETAPTGLSNGELAVNYSSEDFPRLYTIGKNNTVIDVAEECRFSKYYKEVNKQANNNTLICNSTDGDFHRLVNEIVFDSNASNDYTFDFGGNQIFGNEMRVIFINNSGKTITVKLPENDYFNNNTPANDYLTKAVPYKSNSKSLTLSNGSIGELKIYFASSDTSTKKTTTNNGMFYCMLTNITSLWSFTYEPADLQGNFKINQNEVAFDGVSGFYEEETIQLTNTDGMFFGINDLTKLDLRNLNTSNVTDMKNMFAGCNGLTTLNVSNFDTSKVTDMSDMFIACEELTTLDVSNFDTSKVTDMSNMFNQCSKLTTLDVSKWNTSKVTNMSWMFADCSGLTNLNVSKFDTSKVTDMSAMFGSCSGLTTLNVSNFVTSNVTNMSDMFSVCNLLTTLDLSNFVTSNVTNMNAMFSECSELATLNLSGWNTSSVTDMEYMFQDCSKLTNFTAPNASTCYCSIDFSASPLLTTTSIDSIIDWLHDYRTEGTTNTIIFNATTKANLTPSQKINISNKGWTLM